MKFGTKAAIITQARMSSSRLAGKAMKTILGKPLIAYHFERLLKSNLPIFLATTRNDEDDVLASCAKDYEITVYRGDAQDVLSRFWIIAHRYDLQVIIRVTADCPLIDGSLIASSLKHYIDLSDEHLYLSPCLKRSLPRGLDFEIFSRRLLDQAHQNGKRLIDREHVTPYLYHPKPANVRISHVMGRGDLSNWRLCVDTVEDFFLIKKLIEDYRADQCFGEQLRALLKEKEVLQKMNRYVEQAELD